MLFTLMHDAGMCTDDGNPLTVECPLLNLVSVAPINAAVANPGGTFTRTVRACNDGLGFVTNPMQLLDQHGSGVQLLSATVGGSAVVVSGDTIKLTGAYYGADMTLVKGECIDIVETLKVTGCGTGGRTPR